MTALTSLLFATLALGSAAAPLPEYLTFDPAQMILQADLIVEGMITHADAPRVTDDVADAGKTTFTIRVDEVVVGKTDRLDLVVQEFGDWTCARRYAPYEPGQRAIFHLQFKRDSEGTVLRDAPIHVMGAGNEGECPVLGTGSFHRAHMFKGNTRDRHKLYEHEFVGLAIPKAEYAEAARGLLRCYTWDRDPENVRYPFKPDGLRQVCSDAEQETFRYSSRTAEQLLSVLGLTLRLRDR